VGGGGGGRLVPFRLAVVCVGWLAGLTRGGCFVTWSGHGVVMADYKCSSVRERKRWSCVSFRE